MDLKSVSHSASYIKRGLTGNFSQYIAGSLEPLTYLHRDSTVLYFIQSTVDLPVEAYNIKIPAGMIQITQGQANYVYQRTNEKQTYLFLVSAGSNWKSCTESFLFSLVNASGATPTKMPLKGTSNQYGIYCKSVYGPSFGAGHDLYIASGANANSSSFSNLGDTYQCPANANSSLFLAGQKKFSVNEMEVFVFKDI